MWAVHKAHLYFAGTDFMLVVDHRPLIPVLNSKSLDELPSPRLVRLKEKLALHQLTAVWRPGIEHKIVDCFSRYPVDDPGIDDEQAFVEATAHIHAMLFQAQRDHTTDDRILALLEDPISRVSKQKRIRTLNTNNSPQPSMASHLTSADSTAPWDPFSPFVTTYGLPTGLSCMAHAWWFPHDSGKRFSTSCTPPIKAKTALYAGPDRWSTGHPSQTIFAMWSVAARRAQNASPPTPLSPSWSNRRRPARSNVLPPTSSAGGPPLSGVHRPLLWLAHSRHLGPHSHISPGHQPAEGMDVGKRHSSTAYNGWRSPVYLAGIQRVLCQLGNLSYDQQPSS